MDTNGVVVAGEVELRKFVQTVNAKPDVAWSAMQAGGAVSMHENLPFPHKVIPMISNTATE